MAMDGHPTVALQIPRRGIKFTGGVSQLLNQALPFPFQQSHGVRGLLGSADQPNTARLSPSYGSWLDTMARRHQLLLSLTLLGFTAGDTAALANEGLAGSCPLLVAPSNSEFQPKRIQPSQVAAKNAAGCLSPGDAIYGPDGCPIKLCGANAGVIPLPGQ